MTLRLAGAMGVGERIEQLSYTPGIQDSGDLETGTKTITAVAEASGLGNAEYSAALNLPSPSDGRLVVQRIAARLAATIDSMTAGQLSCRVYVDVQDADHLLFDESWTSTGAKLAAQDTLTGTKEVIFDLLKDGSVHTFYFFFWVDSGDSVISLVELWEGVGSTGTTPREAVCLTFTGTMSAAYVRADREGSGSSYLYYMLTTAPTAYSFYKQAQASGAILINDGYAIVVNPRWYTRSAVATDLTYMGYIWLVLRSEA